jgi:glyoxalase family protein
MRIRGIHHITAITAEAQPNIDFYAGVLGLRLVKKTVNFDAPDMYHLYYGDRTGRPGSILTFFEIPGAAPGRAGRGMVHRIGWRVATRASLDFWRDRLAGEGIVATADGDELAFADPEGLAIELVVDASGQEPLVAGAPGIPDEHALRGFCGARAFATDPGRSRSLLEGLVGATPAGDGYVIGDTARSATWDYDAAPVTPGRPGAGTVHHIAWSTEPGEQEAWLERVAADGRHPSPIMDRTYFRSIYFREPSGVLFELATRGPGFAIDEPEETLGRALRLPPQYEPHRAAIEANLEPVRSPHP